MRARCWRANDSSSLCAASSAMPASAAGAPERGRRSESGEPVFEEAAELLREPAACR